MHTPGPWDRNIKPASKYPTIFAGRNAHVAQVVSSGLTPDEVEANCDLIAAAPDLLAALKELLSAPDKHRPARVWEDARAAVARAEGNQ